MPTDHIVNLIDQEIAQLQQARAALAGLGSTSNAPAKRPGRPKGSTNKPTETSAPASNKPAKRTMTAEGKARIAAAQKARWAAQKKAEEPATRKYAVKPKVAKKIPAKAKKAGPGAPEVATTDA